MDKEKEMKAGTGESSTGAKSMMGAVAGAYYGIPADICERTQAFLDPCLVEILNKFEREFLAI